MEPNVSSVAAAGSAADHAFAVTAPGRKPRRLQGRRRPDMGKDDVMTPYTGDATSDRSSEYSDASRVSQDDLDSLLCTLPQSDRERSARPSLPNGKLIHHTSPRRRSQPYSEESPTQLGTEVPPDATEAEEAVATPRTHLTKSVFSSITLTTASPQSSAAGSSSTHASLGGDTQPVSNDSTFHHFSNPKIITDADATTDNHDISDDGDDSDAAVSIGTFKLLKSLDNADGDVLMDDDSCDHHDTASTDIVASDDDTLPHQNPTMKTAQSPRTLDAPLARVQSTGLPKYETVLDLRNDDTTQHEHFPGGIVSTYRNYDVITDDDDDDEDENDRTEDDSEWSASEATEMDEVDDDDDDDDVSVESIEEPHPASRAGPFTGRRRSEKINKLPTILELREEDEIHFGEGRVLAEHEEEDVINTGRRMFAKSRNRAMIWGSSRSAGAACEEDEDGNLVPVPEGGDAQGFGDLVVPGDMPEGPRRATIAGGDDEYAKEQRLADAALRAVHVALSQRETRGASYVLCMRAVAGRLEARRGAGGGGASARYRAAILACATTAERALGAGVRPAAIPAATSAPAWPMRGLLIASGVPETMADASRDARASSASGWRRVSLLGRHQLTDKRHDAAAPASRPGPSQSLIPSSVLSTSGSSSESRRIAGFSSAFSFAHTVGVTAAIFALHGDVSMRQPPRVGSAAAPASAEVTIGVTDQPTRLDLTITVSARADGSGVDVRIRTGEKRVLRSLLRESASRRRRRVDKMADMLCDAEAMWKSVGAAADPWNTSTAIAIAACGGLDGLTKTIAGHQGMTGRRRARA